MVAIESHGNISSPAVSAAVAVLLTFVVESPPTNSVKPVCLTLLPSTPARFVVPAPGTYAQSIHQNRGGKLQDSDDTDLFRCPRVGVRTRQT